MSLDIHLLANGLCFDGYGTLHILGLNGAVLQMFSHGIMTALFFAVVGIIYKREPILEIHWCCQGWQKKWVLRRPFLLLLA
ncbi:MAG: hypothetical protein CM1200mP3_04080 [Chloroflexota bacterium]|nr:MAG: hypothetical protein CM1200mP3_04080 [Chloroflexota bacterium]